MELEKAQRRIDNLNALNSRFKATTKLTAAQKDKRRKSKERSQERS